MKRFLSVFLFASLLGGLAFARPAPPTKPEITSEQQIREYAKIVYFNKNKDVPLKDDKLILNDIANFLKDHPEIAIIEISGHADPTSEKKNAQKISDERVKWAKNYIVSKGVDASRLTTKSYADSQPSTSGKTKKDQAKNRRIEFKILDAKQ
jgi:OOP family OmpA-OmpF porin